MAVIIDKFQHEASYKNEHIVILNHTKFRLGIGSKAHFTQCEIEFDAASNGISMGGSFEDCKIIAKTPLQGVAFINSALRRCTFHGRFIECDFGSVREKSTGIWPFKKKKNSCETVDCDFMAAELDDCRFIACDLKRLVLPIVWPQVILENYQEPARNLMEAESNPDLKLFYKLLAQDMPECKAAAMVAKTIAKRTKLSLDDAKALIKTLSFARTE